MTTKEIKLSTEKSKVVTDPLQFMWLFYGEKGIGKSTLASKMADPYFLCTESAHRHLSIFKTDVTKWTEIEDLVKELCEGKRFKNIVFDVVSGIHQILCEFLVKREGVDDINSGTLSFGKGYREARLKMRRMFNYIGNQGKGVVCLEHEIMKDSNFEGVGEYTRYLAAFTKNEREGIMPTMDIVGRIFPAKLAGPEGEMKLGRFVSFQNTVEWEGADKSDRLSKGDRICLTGPGECWADIEKVWKESEVKRGHGRASAG